MTIPSCFHSFPHDNHVRWRRYPNYWVDEHVPFLDLPQSHFKWVGMSTTTGRRWNGKRVRCCPFPLQTLQIDQNHSQTSFYNMNNTHWKVKSQKSYRQACPNSSGFHVSTISRNAFAHSTYAIFNPFTPWCYEHSEESNQPIQNIK